MNDLENVKEFFMELDEKYSHIDDMYNEKVPNKEVTPKVYGRMNSRIKQNILKELARKHNVKIS